MEAWRCKSVELCLAEEYQKKSIAIWIAKTKATQIPLSDSNYTEQPFMELTVGSICHGCLSFRIKSFSHRKLRGINYASLTQIKLSHF